MFSYSLISSFFPSYVFPQFRCIFRFQIYFLSFLPFLYLASGPGSPLIYSSSLFNLVSYFYFSSASLKSFTFFSSLLYSLYFTRPCNLFFCFPLHFLHCCLLDRLIYFLPEFSVDSLPRISFHFVFSAFSSCIRSAFVVLSYSALLSAAHSSSSSSFSFSIPSPRAVV